MSETKNNKEVYDQAAVTIEEDTKTSLQVEPSETTTQQNEEISSEKPGLWNVAKKICLCATIVFLLLRVIQSLFTFTLKMLEITTSLELSSLRGRVQIY